MYITTKTLKLHHLNTLNWDYANRLQYANLGGGGLAWYVYDASGERVRKVIENDNIREDRLYLSGWELYRKYVNGSLYLTRTSLHVQDGNKRLAIIENDSTYTMTIRYQYDNHLGSASLELDENAQIITYEEYHPFGTTSFRAGRSLIETSLKRYKYIGKERDDETGLYYYGARYYAAWLCRWISTDPAGFVDGLNMYAYVKNNPLKYSDPAGMQSNDEVEQVTPPSKPESEWKYNKELTKNWYPERSDLSVYTSDEFVILKQDVSTHDDLYAMDYFFLNDGQWMGFDPAESTFAKEVERIAITSILVTGGAVGGAVMMESLAPAVVAGAKASAPYLAQATLVAMEEIGMAYNAVMGFAATNPEIVGVALEAAMYELPGVEPIYNPYSSAYSEIVQFSLTAFSLMEEYNPQNTNLANNYEPIPLNPDDNTNLQQPMDPNVRIEIIKGNQKAENVKEAKAQNEMIKSNQQFLNYDYDWYIKR